MVVLKLMVESSLMKGALGGPASRCFVRNKHAEHSLCVVVARLRCSPAVSREDRRGAELLLNSDEVCICGWVCTQESSLMFVQSNVFF